VALCLAVKIILCVGVMGVISDRLKQIEKDLKNKTLSVGWFEDSQYPDNLGGTNVAYVAAIQEFGSVGKNHNIPARPFFKPCIKDNKADWVEYFFTGIELGFSGAEMFNRLGEKIVGNIQYSIGEVDAPPLSPITLAMRYMWEQDKSGFRPSKGMAERVRGQLASTNPPKLSSNTKPLNNSGLLLSSVAYRID